MNKPTFPLTKINVLKAPWDTSKGPAKTYEPIDCDFTDELEFVAVKKIAVEIKYWSKDALVSETVGLIENIETANQEEHLIISNGDRIRLDYIIQLRIKD